MGAATDQLANQALAALQGIINTAIQVGDFVKGELPQVVHELIVYKTIEYSIRVLIGIAAFVAIPLLLKWVIPRFQAAAKRSGDADTGYFMLGLVGTMALISIGIVNLWWIFNLIQILVAPRVWLIEYVRYIVS